MSLLTLNGITKSFAGVPALRNVSCKLDAGEVVGLIGENGAGKSTLIKILAGVHQADSGDLIWQESRIAFANPVDALRSGVATIHQELAYFENLTVAENLMLGEEWPRRSWGATDWRALNIEAQRRLSACELNLNPGALFHTLSPAQRQEVAIARSLAQDAKLLILDEPTASLTEPEVKRLFSHLERLRARNIALLYVSHRLDEILRLTNRVIVLRDGQLVAEYPTSEANVPRMVRDMVGRDLSTDRHALAQSSHTDNALKIPPCKTAEPIFQVQNLTREPLFRDISFSLNAGEILGFAALVGAGRSELARALYGLYSPTAGSMSLDGQPFAPDHPAEARERGLVYIPEERKRQGLVLDHPTSSAISIGFLKSLSRFGLIRPGVESSRVQTAIDHFNIKATDPELPIKTLSGGNQQKALLARWLETDPRLVILDEPTRGVDVGAKAEIHTLIRKLAGQSRGIILISSDLPEILALSNRILVLRSGRIAAEFSAAEATQERVLMAASGFAADVNPLL